MLRKTIPLLLLTLSLTAQDSLNVSVIFNWLDTSIPLNYRDSRYSEVWGFTWGDREYAVIGSTLGAHIFDVTWPQFTYQVDFVPAAVQGFPANHRDYHDYNGYLYAVGDQDDPPTTATLQIIDLHYLPDSVHLVYDSNEFFNRAHNIFIDTATAKLYACATTHADGTQRALEVFSLQNPASPEHLGNFTAAGYIHDVYVRNDTAYCHEPFANILYVVDFSDPASPAILGSLTDYPDRAVCHSGWLTDDGNYYVFADEAYGMRLKICDVSDLTDIQVTATFGSGVSPMSIAHNPIIKGNFVHIAYYNDGYWIYDISDPYNPELAGFYDTFPSPQSDDFRGAWGVYPNLPSGNILISDRNSGLFVLDASAALGEQPTGIEMLESGSQIKVYPQPAKDFFMVDISGINSLKTQFELIGINGQSIPVNVEMQAGNIYKITPDNSLSAGMYLLKMSGENGSRVVKVVVN